MDNLDWFTATILGIVEGVTEFIPVSSTGHLILVGHWMGIDGPKSSVFEVFIQLGAILAVVVVSIDRFRDLLDFRSIGNMKGYRGCSCLFLTTLPALVAGAAFHPIIKAKLFNPMTVMIGLAVGGFAILLVELVLRGRSSSPLDVLTPRQALAIGICQCFALWPGMSRSACTILGGMAFGLERGAAVHYSFLAAVPTMVAAVAYDLWKSSDLVEWSDAPIFATGFLVSFLVALGAIRFFLRTLAKWDLRPFGYYRLTVALVGMLWFLLHGSM